MANRFRMHRIDKVEQFILAYGGLRGAVAFALVLIVSDRIIPTKNMMVTTIIALVFFTVFIQGMTIGPLVRILNVPTKNKIKLSMNERIITRSMDHLMAAIEDIVGQTMGNYHLRDKFKYYNNKYLRPYLTREHANAEPKIFETYSKLNVADAMNLVKSNSNLVPVAANGLGTSLSSIFRTYTQINMDKSPSDEKGNFLTADIPRNNSSFLNVDIATLEYSPSSKDLADAQLHHILSDAMCKPVRRKYTGREDPTHRRAADETRTRLQIRHMLNERLPPRRLNNLSSTPGSSKRGAAAPPDSSEHSERSTSSADANNTKGLISGVKKHIQPPTLRFSVADDDEPSDTPTPMPTQTGTAREEPLSSYSSLLDVSSAQEDDGIVFTVHGQRTPSPNTDAKDGTSESDNDDTSLRSLPTQTLTELQLPWKRDVETGVGGPHDSNTYVHRQQEFPSWVDNSEYYSFESPSNTLLSRIGAASKRVSAPSVFDIFQASSPDGAAAAPGDSNTDSANTKEVVIEIEPNGVAQRSKVVREEDSQATRL
ncbi:hypothetical protein CEXT_62611 [Caerostris extrusa]|uniref:Cation/H+ exchanger transmembrane domain-containing protein n=1 Tax=Caerostris extrusa TaxID=172846 RepID=A0AAV4VTZ7_CAEEX|nr:hypothetical protein CEXT_62611 [Caerostris extrusa]